MICTVFPNASCAFRAGTCCAMLQDAACVSTARARRRFEQVRIFEPCSNAGAVARITTSSIRQEISFSHPSAASSAVIPIVTQIRRHCAVATVLAAGRRNFRRTLPPPETSRKISKDHESPAPPNPRPAARAIECRVAVLIVGGTPLRITQDLVGLADFLNFSSAVLSSEFLSG